MLELRDVLLTLGALQDLGDGPRHGMILNHLSVLAACVSAHPRPTGVALARGGVYAPPAETRGILQ